MNPVEITTVAAPVLHTDFSALKLFLEAHFVVQLVMAGLVLASVWSWAIIAEKMLLLARTKRQADGFEQRFWSGQSLEELFHSIGKQPASSMAALFVAAMREWKRSVESTPKPLAGLQMRVEKVLDVALSREIDVLERRLLFLATVGSTAPFIGLFGTVWGIITSFQAIAMAKTTSLSVVAPGIAEALLATALGLLAAIPAVIVYNEFTHEVSRHAQRLESFADEFSAILSRQLDARS